VTGNPRDGEPDQSIDRAAALVRSLPLRWAEGDQGDNAEAVIARGWFRGAAECARVLTTQAALEPRGCQAFGASWPMLERGSWTIAPALPVVVGPETAIGPDAEYRRDSLGVWREACGDDSLYMVTDQIQPTPGAEFELLWFGDYERFMVRNRMLEIEDLFGALRLPASPRRLDHLLIRSRRVGPGVLVGVETNDREGPQSIEVRRAADLSRDHHWRDALNFLAARADIESAKQRGATIEARTAAGARVIFELDEEEDGWGLTVRDGRYVFSGIRIKSSLKTLAINATLDDEVDAMAPGMRGRLVFDLRADLVALG